MIIQSKKVWIAGQFIPAQLEVADGKITAVREYGERSVDQDYGTKRIVPGFIDVHTHGAYGYDTNDGEPEGLRNWMKHIPEEGVTSILPVSYTHLDVYKRQVFNETVLPPVLGPVTTSRSKSLPKCTVMGTTFDGSKSGWRPSLM